MSHASLRLVHHHPGYVRAASEVFVGPESKGSAASAARLAAEQTSGFRKFKHNEKTGSIVVEYDPRETDVDELLKQIAKRADIKGVVNDAHEKRYRKDVVDGFLSTVEDVNHAFSELTLHRADLRELVPLTLVGVSIASFILNDQRGRLPSWDSALYRAYRIFLNFHREEIRRDEAEGRKIEKKLTHEARDFDEFSD